MQLSPQANKYLLLDGNNLAHIAFHRGKSILQKIRIKNNPDKDKNELAFTEKDYSEIENMMYHVFFLKLHKHFRIFKGYHFIICWDNFGSSEWRREIYADYKVRRDYEKDPIWNVLFDGIKNLQQILQSYPVSQETIEKLEADDIMYAFSRDLSKRGEVIIISGDSDMIQAVQDFGVKLYHPIKDKYIKAPTTYDYCLFKAIKGDPTDDIEGLYGYGPVKSAKLAEAYESDSNSLDKLTDEQKEIILRNLHLIEIKNNPNLSKAIPNLDKIHAAKNVNLSKIQKFYFDHKLRTLIEDFDSVVSLFA